ncbi:MAG: ACT domain-containing protein [Clostridiales bacterium]|nr:ACT domain-containing protein [Clostridiales bacterium]
MKAIVTVIGKDKRGIIAKVSNALYEVDANIEDISQTVLQEYFVMIMLADISQCKLKIGELSVMTDRLAGQIGVSIKIQHEDIFNSMHKI